MRAYSFPRMKFSHTTLANCTVHSLSPSLSYMMPHSMHAIHMQTISLGGKTLIPTYLAAESDGRNHVFCRRCTLFTFSIHNWPPKTNDINILYGNSNSNNFRKECTSSDHECISLSQGCSSKLFSSMN